MFKTGLGVLAIVFFVSVNAFGFFGGDDYVIHNHGGRGGNANAKIEEGAIDNDNTNINLNCNSNRNSNSNRNHNTNVNLQGQGQQQGQKQKQKQQQGQFQGQGQMNNWSQKFEDKRELLDAPNIPTTKADLRNHGDVNDVKTRGSIWKRLDGISLRQAKHASKGASDIDLESALLYENDFMTTYINKGQSGEFMGYLYVMPDGSDCTLAQMEAKGLKEAMKAGANFAVIFYSEGKYLEGSSWGVGTGGGASLFAKGDSVGIAPNGGLGYSKAYSNNELRPALVIAIFIQPDLIFEKIEKNPDRYEISR